MGSPIGARLSAPIGLAESQVVSRASMRSSSRSAPLGRGQRHITTTTVHAHPQLRPHHDTEALDADRAIHWSNGDRPPLGRRRARTGAWTGAWTDSGNHHDHGKRNQRERGTGQGPGRRRSTQSRTIFISEIESRSHFDEYTERPPYAKEASAPSGTEALPLGLRLGPDSIGPGLRLGPDFPQTRISIRSQGVAPTGASRETGSLNRPARPRAQPNGPVGGEARPALEGSGRVRGHASSRVSASYSLPFFIT